MLNSIIFLNFHVSRCLYFKSVNLRELQTTLFALRACWQDAGEASVANIDKLRHADGKISPAELRLKMQKVIVITYLNLLFISM